MKAISIFLADDHTILRDGLQALLDAQPDFKVVGAASNGCDAVSQVKQHQPDVVIMDISMPEMNGIEATQRICSQSPNTRVIILSMHHSPEHISRALQAGARGYLLKESASDELIEAVRGVQAGRRYLSQDISDTVIDYYLSHHQREAAQNPLIRLNKRERETLQLIAEGKSSTEIAERFSLSARTIESYRSSIMKKLDIHHLPGLVKFAIQHGLISLE